MAITILREGKTLLIKTMQAVKLTQEDGQVSYDLWDAALIKHIDDGSLVAHIEPVGEPVPVSVYV